MPTDVMPIEDPPAPRTGTINTTKLRVLLGEDNSSILQETQNLLRDEFDLIAAAENGLRLIAAARELKPDIVVTDIGMPLLNGIEASRQILDSGCCKTIVALSADNSPEIVRTALAIGILAYVLKENAGEDLIAAIHAAAVGKTFLSAGLRSTNL